MGNLIKDIEQELRYNQLLDEVNEVGMNHASEFIDGLMRQIDLEELERGIPFTLVDFQDFVGDMLENDPMYTPDIDAQQIVGLLWQKYQGDRQLVDTV